eukprot:76275-Pyramimonas_sp.AAC.1
MGAPDRRHKSEASTANARQLREENVPAAELAARACPWPRAAAARRMRSRLDSSSALSLPACACS